MAATTPLRRGTLRLVLAAAIAVAALVVDGLVGDPAPVELASLPELIPAGQVVAFEVTSDERAVAYRRVSGRWRVVRPAGATDPAGGEESVESFVREVSPLHAYREVDAPLEEAGLAPARTMASLEFSSGTRITLRLGAATLQEGGDFATVDGRPAVYVVPSRVQELARAVLDSTTSTQ